MAAVRQVFITLIFLFPLASPLPHYPSSYSPFYGLPSPTFSFGPQLVPGTAYGYPVTVRRQASYIPHVGTGTGSGSFPLLPAIPAGIVQSTQPQFVQRQFMNSKLSPQLANYLSRTGAGGLGFGSGVILA
eukprot:GFUD01127063.1.p1 GENE.GFUD01127063.1~~GFUD01127063.1.p1  ORF type:complete len:130 (-),score=25.80 GFUD01127063.1:10-399(-)